MKSRQVRPPDQHNYFPTLFLPNSQTKATTSLWTPSNHISGAQQLLHGGVPELNKLTGRHSTH